MTELKKYKVTITHTHTATIYVKASDPENAKELAEEAYVLDDDLNVTSEFHANPEEIME